MPAASKGRVDQSRDLAHGADRPAWIDWRSAGVDSFPAAQNMCERRRSRARLGTTSRASLITLASGLWMMTCCPARSAASEPLAWR